jgi:tRNA pseudouridine55 synthase
VPENRAPAPSAPRRSGILLVDKAAGFTSHDAVALTRRLAGTRKVGHAGTLDPMATGLLILGLNSSTRLLTYLVGLDKEYLATIRLGAATTTDDADGEITATASPESVAAVTAEQLREQMLRLTGQIQQVPSSVSAIKVNGKRAYARVRAGEEFALAARPVTVSAFELLGQHAAPGRRDLDVRVECSSGTYIRALARDLGAALGVGGHLIALRRTRVGPFRAEQAATLDGLDVAARLLDPAQVAAALFPSVALEAEQVVELMHGKRVSVPADILDGLAPDAPVAALAPDGRLVGLVTVFGTNVKPLVNFPTDEVLA